MAQINVAFEVLSDPVRRMEYDSSIGLAASPEREKTQGERSKPNAVQVAIHKRLREHGTPIYGLGFEARTGRMVSSSFDNEILWWDEKFNAPVTRHKFEGGVVNTIEVVGKDKIVAAGCTEQTLSCWTWDDASTTSWRQNPRVWTTCVAPSPDGKWLAYASVDRSFTVVRAVDGITKISGCTHKDAVTALAWSNDSQKIATGSADATVKIWDASNGKELATLLAIRSSVTAMAFSPDQRWLAVAAVDLSIRIFRMADLTLQKTFFGHEKPVEALAFHPRSWLMASASRDGTIGLYNVKQGVGHGRIEASHQALSALKFSPDGRYLASGGLDKILRIWKLSATTSDEQAD